MKNHLLIVFSIVTTYCYCQNPTPFACNGSDGFGYYTSSETSTTNGNVLVYSNSRISKIITSSGLRTTLCPEVSIDVALNAMAFNPHDNYLYAVSRYDVNEYSGKLYRIGENCQKKEILVSGSLIKFLTNNRNTVDASGGNLSSGTFDLDNNYYLNTSFTNTTSTGFTNKLQKIALTGNSASVLSTVNLTCPTCTGTSKLSVTDIIFDEASNSLYGSNTQTNKLYKINSSTGVLTLVGTTGITSPILGMYKNRDGNIRAISETGNIYSVNLTTGVFTLISTVSSLNSGNADAASGCYAPPKITGHLFLDANGLVDNLVNGIPVGLVGGTQFYANLIKGGLIVKTDLIDSTTGLYQFLGLFTGSYEVQISTIPGTIGLAPPASNLPNNFVFTGDHIGTNAGNDGVPNGKISIIVTNGIDIQNVNFGINSYPIAKDVDGGLISNPGGSIRVTVPSLSIKDLEEPNINSITIKTLPNSSTQGLLYYDGTLVSLNQFIPNYNPNLLTFDPVDGNVTMMFTYFTTDMAGLISNIASVTQSYNIVLPIILEYFKGNYTDNKVILKWQTVSEVNNSHFLLEKSDDGSHFIVIDNIASNMKSNKIKYYQTIDKNAHQNAYYRLCQIDYDGNSSYSNTIFIEVSKSDLFTIDQEIAASSIQVNYNFDKETVAYKIINYIGQEVKQGSLNEFNNNVSISNIQSGLYYLSLVDKRGNLIGTSQFIKM